MALVENILVPAASVTYLSSTVKAALDALQSGLVVDYAQFGAVGDGTTDDTAAVIAAHAYANANKLPVRVVGGSYYVNLNNTSNQLRIGVDCKWVNARLRFNNMSGFGIFVPPESETVLTQADVVISEFQATRTSLPSLSAYKNHHAVISSTEQDLNRKRDSGPAPQAKSQPVILGAGGLLNAPLYTTFGSISEVRLQPLVQDAITLDGLHLEVFGDATNLSPIGIRRNGVTIKNLRFTDNSTTQVIPVQSLVSFEFCCGGQVLDPVCDALAKDATTSYNYVINIWKSSNIRISGMHSFDGWAQVDGNYFRGLVVEDSTIDRVGSHFRGFDCVFRNLSARRGRCIDVAGGGYFLAENINVQTRSTDDEGYVIGVRGDYGAEWDGRMVARNIVVDERGLYSAASGRRPSIISAQVDSTVGAHDFGRVVQLPTHVSIENCSWYLNNQTDCRPRGYAIGCTSSIVSALRYPESLEVRDLSVHVLGVTKYRLKAGDLLAGTKIADKGQLLSIRVSGIRNVDPRTYSETVLDDADATLFCTLAGTQLQVQASIENCDFASVNLSGSGAGFGRGHSVTVTGGSVTYLNGYGNVQMHFRGGTEFFGTRFRGSWKGTCIGCLFQNYVDFSSASVAVGNGATVDTYLTAVQGTPWAVGATVTVTGGSALTASTSFTGWKQSTYWQ